MSNNLSNEPEKNEAAAPAGETAEEQLSLNDDRRVKVLSPGAMVRRRFFRNKIAVVGLVILLLMFVFSFVGGVVSPYTEAQQFYRNEQIMKSFGAAVRNKDYRFRGAPDQDFSSIIQAQMVVNMQTGKNEFKYKGTEYSIHSDNDNLYELYSGDTLIGIATTVIVTPSDGTTELSFEFVSNALKADNAGETSFEADGVTYSLDEGGVVTDASGTAVADVGEYVIQAIMADAVITSGFREELIAALEAGLTSFEYNGSEYQLEYDAAKDTWEIKQFRTTQVIDTYAFPSAEHPLGTDKNGMDMLTRLMYGGRVSLIIGFIVVFIETAIGVVLGGVAGYFGGWVDELIMRVVDVFYCIPSLPIIIIIGAAMDAQRMPSAQRMFWLMLILGVLGWAGVARLVRGQILSLREQEFMTAEEACGMRISKRIFKHLIPNVIPQLIVTSTMGLGSTIITEATLSFLGLGVKYPFASWGNIINDVNNTYVLTTYLFIWIPAGICLLATVLAFNLLGDGLRDAFDPKMKR